MKGLFSFFHHYNNVFLKHTIAYGTLLKGTVSVILSDSMKTHNGRLKTFDWLTIRGNVNVHR